MGVCARYAPRRGDRATDAGLRDQSDFPKSAGQQRLYGATIGRFRCPPAASYAAATNTNSISRCGDDLITVTWRIVDIFERETSRAGVVIFVLSEARYTNQHGDLLAVNRETNIHQP